MVTEPREHYDLLTVLIICLGETLKETGVYGRILNLLNILFRSNLPLREKIEILEQEFNIPMTYEMREEVNHMCNLGEGIARRAMEQGIEEAETNFIDIINLIAEKKTKGDILSLYPHMGHIIDKLMSNNN